MSTMPVTNVNLRLSSASSEQMLRLSLAQYQPLRPVFEKTAELLFQHFGNIHVFKGELLG